MFTFLTLKKALQADIMNTKKSNLYYIIEWAYSTEKITFSQFEYLNSIL